MNERKIPLRTRIAYGLLQGSCRLVGLLPDWLLYHCLLDVLYWLLYRVARYRLRIVRHNLLRAFPGMQRSELRRIERDFYKHLAEVLIDTIDLSGISEKSLRKRLRVIDAEEHQRRTAGRDWIAMMAHYGCWEYFGAYQLYDRQAQVLGVYHPLHESAFDLYYRRMRSRFGLLPVPMKELLRFYLYHRDRPGRPNYAIGLIADQRPKVTESKFCFRFLNQPTLFHMGGEKMALKFGLPVYLMRVRKVRRAHYEVSFEQLYDGSEAVEEGVITARYVAGLEAMIRRDPPLWMWSHRRWKYPLAEDTLKRYYEHKSEP